MKPWDFEPELTEERLQIIGRLLSEIYNTSAEEHRQLGDTPYVIGTVCFGRAHEALLHLTGYDWYQVTRTTFDITFNIGGIPCRFFSTTDPDNPKAKVYNRNPHDSLFPEIETAPCLWRFLIQKPISEEFDQYEVFFVGFDVHHNIRAQWCLTNSNINFIDLDRVVDTTGMENYISKPASWNEVPISKKSSKKTKSNE